MMAHALIVSVTIMVAVVWVLLDQCRFLIPYRRLLVEQYGITMLCWAGVLWVNLFAGVYALGRRLFLKDTGHKLAHLEKQIRSGHSVANDLTHRLHE